MIYIKINEDMIVATNGDEYRRAETDEWLEYEEFIENGGMAQEQFTEEQWNALSENSKRRLTHVAPTS